MKEIWVEKYRPASLDAIVGQEEVVSRLKAYVRAGNLPHLLFAGPAGTGKTTSAIVLARDLFGDEWRAEPFWVHRSAPRGKEGGPRQTKKICQPHATTGGGCDTLFP